MPLADVRSIFLELSGRNDLQSEASVTGVYTDSGLSVAYTSGGVEDDDLYIKMAQADAAKFRKNQTVVLRVSSDYDTDVVATVVLTTLNGASSYVRVNLEEDDDNSSLTDLSDCNKIAHTRVLNLEYYINEAQRFLDRLCDHSKIGARYFLDLTSSQIFVPLFQCRSITKVFVGDSEYRTELVRKDIHELREYYNEPKANITAETPAYWAPIWTRPVGRTITPSDYNQSWLMDDIVTSNSEQYNGLIIWPPADSSSTYTLEVWGKFYNERLLRLSDKSYWTEEHSMLLANAAMGRLEATYRNTEGLNDWLSSVNIDISEIIKDDVEDEDIDQMEG